MPMRPIITLISDWRLRDPYVAMFKGALLSESPEANLLDITHYVDVFNLKVDDMFFRDVIIREEGIMPAYHMNKMHWITVLLDGTVP